MTEETALQRLNLVFDALANEHRRAIIYALSLQPHAISELAAQRGLSLPAIHKHIKVLEWAGLVRRMKAGRTHFLALRRESLREVQAWLEQYQTYWGSDEETLENYVKQLEQKAVKSEEKR